MTWDEYIKNGSVALARADYRTAEAEFANALCVAKASFEHTDPRIPQTISCLGQAYFLQRKFDEAEPLLKQSIKLNTALKASDLQKGSDLYCLGCILKHRGLASKAEETFSEALPLIQRNLPQSEVLQLIAVLQQVISDAVPGAAASKPVSPPRNVKELPPPLQRPQPTEEQYTEWANVLNAGLELINSEEQSQIIAGYNQLNDLLIHWYKTFLLPHPCAAETLNGLALAASYLGIFERAKNLFHLSIRDMEATIGPETLETARIKLNLALLYKDQDDSVTGPTNADLYFRQSFDIFKHDPGMDQEWFNATAQAFTIMLERSRLQVESYHEYDKIYELEQKHKLEEAAEAASRLHSKLKQYFPDSSPCYVRLFNDQARILQKLGRTAEAQLLRAGADRISQDKLEKIAMQRLLEDQLPPVPTPWDVESKRQQEELAEEML